MGLTWQSFLCELRGRVGDSNGADLLRKTHTYSPHWIPEFVFIFFQFIHVTGMQSNLYVILLSFKHLVFFVGGKFKFSVQKKHTEF